MGQQQIPAGNDSKKSKSKSKGKGKGKSKSNGNGVCLEDIAGAADMGRMIHRLLFDRFGGTE